MLDSQQTDGTSVDEGDEGGDDDPSNPERSTNSSPCSAGALDWSSNDGFSFLVIALLATADMSVDARATVTPEDAVTAGRGSKFVFVPVGDPVDADEGDAKARKMSSMTSSANDGVTRTDLDEAIQDGDLEAVGATAALIADPTASGGGAGCHVQQSVAL